MRQTKKFMIWQTRQKGCGVSGRNLFYGMRSLRKQRIVLSKMMSSKRNVTGQLDQANYCREHETPLSCEYDAGIVGRSFFCAFQDDAAQCPKHYQSKKNISSAQYKTNTNEHGQSDQGLCPLDGSQSHSTPADSGKIDGSIGDGSNADPGKPYAQG